MLVDKELLEKIRTFSEDFLRSLGYELVELVCKYEAKRLILRILADRPQGGITLDECADLNNKIGKLIEEQDLIKESYILEVCSPGLDRPLKELNDFRRCIDRDVVVYIKQPLEGKMEYRGRVKACNERVLCLELRGKDLDIPLDKITKAKQLIE